MSIHTLHDLCYAYRVADPVREMLFALQDRITELEAQRKPLTEQHPLMVFAKECVLGAYPEKELADAAKRAIEAAHNIKDGQMKHEHPDFPDPDNSIALDLVGMVAGVLISFVAIFFFFRWWHS